MSDFTIANGAFSRAIYIGRVNKEGTAFTKKEDHTDRAIRVVAEHILGEFGGNLTIDYRDGVQFQISVKHSAEAEKR